MVDSMSEREERSEIFRSQRKVRQRSEDRKKEKEEKRELTRVGKYIRLTQYSKWVPPLLQNFELHRTRNESKHVLF